MDKRARDHTSDMARNIIRKTAIGWRRDIAGKLAIKLTKVQMITFAEKAKAIPFASA